MTTEKKKQSILLQDSGNTEYYTPLPIILAAHRVMGGIDLDPASSKRANRIVKADRFYAQRDDGLNKPWSGRVWMNHPFSRDGNKKWIDKLLDHWVDGDLDDAMCITYASTGEKWFRELMDWPQCFLWPRTNYLTPDGKIKHGVTKGSVVTYLGPNLKRFMQVFDGHLGTVKI